MMFFGRKVDADLLAGVSYLVSAFDGVWIKDTGNSSDIHRNETILKIGTEITLFFIATPPNN